MHERALGVHQVELVVEAGEHLRDGGGVGDHAHGALHLGEVTAGHHGGGLVVDTALEAGGAPVDELDGALGLDGGDGGVDVLGDDVTTVHETARHVLAVAGVALGHHGGGLVRGVGDLRDGELLVVRLLRGDHGGVRGEHEVDPGVGHEVGLELGDVDVERAVEAKRRGEGRHDLADQAVEVGVGGALDVEGSTADVVDGFVVEHDGDVGVLQEGVRGKHGVVGFHDSGGDLGGGVDSEPELGLLAIVNGKALEEEGTETGTGTTTDGVEYHETLEAGAVVRELAQAVEAQVHDLFADCIVASCEIVRRVFLAGDELLGVEELAVRAGADFVDHGGFEIEENATGDVLARAGFGEEGVERIIAAADGLIRGHLAVRLYPMLEAVKLPARVTGLDAGLTDVDGDDFTHGKVGGWGKTAVLRTTRLLWRGGIPVRFKISKTGPFLVNLGLQLKNDGLQVNRRDKRGD